MADRPLEQDYAPLRAAGSRGGRIASVEEGGPAWAAGLRAGMTLTAADGVELRDAIDWEWVACGPRVEVEGVSPVGLLGESAAAFGETGGATQVEFQAELSREAGQAWGLSFADPVFDHVITCKNRCTFCFMSMLPPGMRRTLYLRDDDYRLSFLQGNFVTLTNVTEKQADRIVECGLSPLHVSLHAVSHKARRVLMGPNEARGLALLDRLLDAGIEAHAQVVLVPGVNDGAELERTFSFVEDRPGILTCGFVPLGFTRHQTRFDRGFEDPAAARAVIEQARPHQERARRELGVTRFQLSDEFYLNAGAPLPPAESYDGFPQYEDGIGMLRSFTDAWDALKGEQADVASALAAGQRRGAARPLVASGEAFVKFFSPLLAASPLAGLLTLVPVENRFFGGNVDVAGLLTAFDLEQGLASAPPGPVVVPDVILNSDGLTLDGADACGLARRLGRETRMVSSTAAGLLQGLRALGSP